MLESKTIRLTNSATMQKLLCLTVLLFVQDGSFGCHILYAQHVIASNLLYIIYIIYNIYINYIYKID